MILSSSLGLLLRRLTPPKNQNVFNYRVAAPDHEKERKTIRIDS
jgi:hypothetical protein